MDKGFTGTAQTGLPHGIAVIVLTDEETGCDYLVVIHDDNAIAAMPRLDANGKPVRSTRR